jgi:hypothetical protein
MGMRKINIVTLLILLMAMAIPAQAFDIEFGSYNFVGAAWHIIPDNDSKCLFEETHGAWLEVAKDWYAIGSVSKVNFGSTTNIPIGILQGTTIWNRMFVALGPTDYIVSPENGTDTHYFAIKGALGWFPKGFARKSGGFVAALEFVPDLHRKKVTIGTAIIF